MKEDEIDVVKLIRALSIKRQLIFKVAGICLVLGIFVALTGKVEYQASCQLMPEVQEASRSGLSSLSGLAGLAGINLDVPGTGGLLSPTLYPQIVESVYFQLDVLNTPIYYERLDTTLSSYVFFTEVDKLSVLGSIARYTIGLPGVIKSLFRDDSEINKESPGGFLRLSLEDNKLIETFKNRIVVEVDPKTGIVSITAEMPDPVAAAALADLVVRQLKEAVIGYKTEKAQMNLEFIQSRFDESANDFSKKQETLALFTDKNKAISSARAAVNYQRLQNEYNIAYDVYKNLAAQLEQAKIKVKEETPVFRVLEPVKVPVEKSKPRRMLIILGFSVAGVFFTVTGILLKELFPEFNQLSNNQTD